MTTQKELALAKLKKMYSGKHNMQLSHDTPKSLHDAVELWVCPDCSNSFDSEDEARDCCESKDSPERGWFCSECEKPYDTEAEARNCTCCDDMNNDQVTTKNKPKDPTGAVITLVLFLGYGYCTWSIWSTSSQFLDMANGIAELLLLAAFAVCVVDYTKVRK